MDCRHCVKDIDGNGSSAGMAARKEGATAMVQDKSQSSTYMNILTNPIHYT
jgi:hypothetical protein